MLKGRPGMNRLHVFVVAGALVACLGAGLVRAAAVSDRTVRDGVYTAAQAKQGESVYVNKCSECHDGGLMGPELDGHEFLDSWKNKSLDNLYKKILVTMPADNPGTLKELEALDVLAYLLQANGFPAGETAIDAAAAAAVTFADRP